MNSNIGYDKTDRYSIEKYAQGMIGKRFIDFLPADYAVVYDNVKAKGGLGVLIEEHYFHYEPNFDSSPDFKEAGVELKSAGYVVHNHNYRAKERLVLTMIDYMKVVEDEGFINSHLWYKCEWMLLVFYQYKKDMNRLDFRIDYAKLFTPSETDLAIIRADYDKIISKIKAGRAHELSEADTLYLGAATKSATSSNRRKQPYSDIPAKPRAFSYKVSYMTYVFNTYILNQKPLYESIIKDKRIDDFESYILDKLNHYKGIKVDDLCHRFNVDTSKSPKNLGAMLAFRMLDVKSNGAEEFVKAGIVVKTIRVETTGRIKEHMSFPNFEFLDIIQQDWEDSDFYNTLSTTKFLFVIFQKAKDGSMYFHRAMFWNMPYDILENEVRLMWNKTKDVLLHIDQIKELHNGKHYISIFPKQSENPVSHVRPKARDSKDVYPLPDGRVYPKQCFWLNNSYILSVIKEK